MADEYLWNGTGDPDPEIARLESLFVAYRLQAPKRSPTRRFAVSLAAIAAAVVLVAVVLKTRNPHVMSEWRVGGTAAHVGQTVETRTTGTTIESEAVGQILLDPDSKLEILKSTENLQQLSLRRGTLHATIWAPPSRFVVQTPSAATIDLGCSYTLSVTDDQSSFLTVETGWVAFRKNDLESFIPAGAACRTHPRLGPGLPYWTSSERPFRDAVSQFDLTNGKQGLDQLLSLATPHDALTLWHLIRRTSGRDRDQVVARFTTFLPNENADPLRRGEIRALDKAWDSLGLGATGLFRTFQERWR